MSSEPKTTWRVDFRTYGTETWYPESQIHDSRELAQSAASFLRNTYAEDTRIIRIETREFVEEER